MKTESGYASFAECWKDCCNRACYRLSYEAGKTDPALIAAREEADALYHTIEEKLGQDGRLVDEFDAAKNFSLGLSDEYIYQQGFQDCVFLLRWINLT